MESVHLCSRESALSVVSSEKDYFDSKGIDIGVLNHKIVRGVS